MVRRVVLQPAAEAESSTRTGAVQNFIMQSEDEPVHSRRLNTPSTSSASHSLSVASGEDVDPDEPLPSIETEPGLEGILTTSDDSDLRGRSPSFSITPPTSGGSIIFTPSSATASGVTPVAGSQVSSLDGRMAVLELPRNSTPHRSFSREGTSTTPGDGYGRASTTPNVTHHGGNAAPTSPVIELAANMAAIGLGPDESSPPYQRTYLSPQSPSPDRMTGDVASSPGSASRRRSGSHVDPTPHDVTDEEPPHERFHDPDVQLQLAISKGLVEDLVYILESSALHDEPESRIRALHSQAVELSQYQNPSARTVGLVGDSGVGKSSLLNSLLDRRGFARTSNSGRACTCVATEYHYQENANFALEVEYFTQEELRKQFTELLQAYRTHHLHDDTTTAADDSTDLQKRAEVAEDTFRAAFRNHLAQDERFLLENEEGHVLQTLLTWAMNTGLPVVEGTNMVPRTEFASAEIFSDHLMELTSEPVDPSELSKWPFIRKIRVYLNAYILSQGLVLVDLPGLRDLNSARLKITERYLLHCDEIFAVCNIGRATSDPGVKEVFELARRASLSKIGIICTKSDDIRADEAVRDCDGETRMEIQRMRGNVDNHRKAAERTEAAINALTLDNDVEDEMDEELERELGRLNIALSRTRKRLARAEFELDKFLVTTRNQRVTAALQTLNENQISAANLAVFCVSNLIYWAHRDEPKERAMPFLQLSGILQVRRKCLSLVVEGQLRAATKYITNAIPALLGSVELWIQAGAGSASAERKQAIRSALDHIEENLEAMKVSSSTVNSIGLTMNRRFTERITQLMTRESDRWSAAAIDATVDWAGWNHGTYSAFCKNYGDHRTAATQVRRCWNDEAMQAMVTCLRTPWQDFRQTTHRLQDGVSQAIEDIFERAIAQSSPPGLPTNSLQTLTVTLRHRQAMLVTQVEEACDEFENGVSILWTDTSSGIRTSFMGQAMEQSYNTCRLDGGTGSDARRKATIRNGFGNDRLFPTIQRQFRNRFIELSRELDTKIQEAVTTHLAVVQRDVDTLRNENVALESESHPEFRARLENAVRDIRERLAEAIAVYARLAPPTV